MGLYDDLIPDKNTNLRTAAGGTFRSDAADAWERMVAGAAKEGVNLRIESGGSYRTRAQQAAAHKAKPRLVAPPGHSNHEKGIAVDVAEGRDWVRKNGARYGWNWGERPDEDWHFTYGRNYADRSLGRGGAQATRQGSGRGGLYDDLIPQKAGLYDDLLPSKTPPQSPQDARTARPGTSPTPNGLLVPGNIDLHKRPVVKNKDGSISTVRSISVNMDGKEVLIPTVSPDGKILTNDQAVALFRKTGQHLGMFDTPEHATAYAQNLHNQQAKEYAPTPNTPQQKEAAKLLSRYGAVNRKIDSLQKEIDSTKGAVFGATLGGASLPKANQLRKLKEERDALKKHPLILAKNLADLGIQATKWSAQDIPVKSQESNVDFWKAGIDKANEAPGVLQTVRGAGEGAWNAVKSIPGAIWDQIQSVALNQARVADQMAGVPIEKQVKVPEHLEYSAQAKGLFSSVVDAIAFAGEYATPAVFFLEHKTTPEEFGGRLANAVMWGAGAKGAIEHRVAGVKKRFVEAGVPEEIVESHTPAIENIIRKEQVISSKPPVEPTVESKGAPSSTEPRPTSRDTTSKVSQEGGATPPASTKPVTVFRGGSEDGMWWTTDEAKAKQLSDVEGKPFSSKVVSPKKPLVVNETGDVFGENNVYDVAKKAGVDLSAADRTLKVADMFQAIKDAGYDFIIRKTAGGRTDYIDLHGKPGAGMEPSAPPASTTIELASGLNPNIEKFVAEDVVPTVKKAAEGAVKAADDLRASFSPATRGDAAARAAGTVREWNARRALALNKADASLSSVEKAVDKLPQADRWKFVDDIESGSKQPNAELQDAHNSIRAVLDATRDEVISLGEGHLENFIENYFPHIWDRPDKSVVARLLGKRPLEGSKTFLKQRTIPTIREGLDAGLKPATNSPVEMVRIKLAEMQRYIMAQKIFSEMKNTGLVQFVKSGRPVPDGYVPINDNIAVKRFRTDKGVVDAGRYYATESAAKILNNFLSPGLRGNQVFRSVHAVNNVMNQAQLGFSLFHGGFVAMDTVASKTALGVYALGKGDVATFVKSVFNAALGPKEVIAAGWRGAQLRKAALDPLYNPKMAPVVDALMEAGGRLQMDTIYKNEAIKKMREAAKSGNYIGAMVRTPLAMLEAVSIPVMEWMVPRVKLGVFRDMAEFELRKLPADATIEQRRAVMGKAWDSVENRLGQLAYDNLFWNKVTKDIGMVGTRALGWNIGTIRELGGGYLVDPAVAATKLAKTRKLEITHRMAYAVGLPMTVALYSAVYQYLHTGKAPEEMRDYFQPKTGAKRGDQDERVNLPTYMKDVIHWTSDPYQTAKNKLAPWITEAVEQLENNDFYSGPIRNEDDPVVQQALDSLKHLGAAFLPFSYTTSKRRARQDDIDKMEAFIGVTPIGKEMTQAEKIRAEGLRKLAQASELSGGKKQPKKQSTAGTATVPLPGGTNKPKSNLPDS